MKKYAFFLLCTLSILSSSTSQAEEDSTPDFLAIAKQPGAVSFTPPNGWQLADSKSLPKAVQVMVVGKGQRELPPTINLAVDHFNGTLREYLKTRVKATNDSQGADWKDLGTIQTEAGNASLSQVDVKTSWGEIREMHVILIKNSTVYILTAAALKEEFPKFYKDFFRSLRSLKINPEQSTS